LNRKLTKQRTRSRVWLRSKENNRFYSRTGEWVHSRDNAFDFTDVQKALAYAKTSAIKGLEVILETSRGDFPIPVLTASSAPHFIQRVD